MNARCIHCIKRRAADGKRGLCWHCYNAPAVRDLYPSSRNGNNHAPTIVPNSTVALPGSEAKIDALSERVRLQQGLWSCDDPVQGVQHLSRRLAEGE